MRDSHVHPAIRKIARKINADDVRASTESQHVLIFEDVDDFEVKLHEITSGQIDVNVHNIRNARYTEGVEVTVFLKETTTVDVWESSGNYGNAGIQTYTWRGERARRKPQTA